jgi:hypothetical protein
MVEQLSRNRQTSPEVPALCVYRDSDGKIVETEASETGPGTSTPPDAGLDGCTT